MTGLWTGGEGEAGRGASEPVGVLPRRGVLSWHGRGLGGGETVHLDDPRASACAQ